MIETKFEFRLHGKELWAYLSIKPEQVVEMQKQGGWIHLRDSIKLSDILSMLVGDLMSNSARNIKAWYNRTAVNVFIRTRLLPTVKHWRHRKDIKQRNEFRRKFFTHAG